MLCSSSRAVDDPDSSAFYDSGLLTMPTLGILLSILSATLFLAVIGSTWGLATLLVYDPSMAALGLSVTLGLNPVWIWIFIFIICCFFALVVSILFSFLVSSRGSHERTQHPRTRRAFQVLVAVVFTGVFYTSLMLGFVGWFMFSAVSVIYILCCLFLAGW